MKYELNRMFNEFFKENPNGIVTIMYPNRLDGDKYVWDYNKYGISFTKGSYMNKNKIIFKKEGVFIKHTLGFSLITGKHLYIPYNQIQSVLFEEEGDEVVDEG